MEEKPESVTMSDGVKVIWFRDTKS